LFIALLFVIAMACTPIVRAAGVVSSCGEGSLLTAVSGGEMVTFTCSGTITLTATITISADTTIDGTGRYVTISGGNAVQIFFVSPGVNFNLNKVTIANGSDPFGGGILNQGMTTVTNSAFSGNYSSSYGGGAIINAPSGLLDLVQCLFDGNVADYGGGVITNYGTLVVTDSTFFNNRGYIGGAIDSFGALTVTNSTFSGNNTEFYGGGVLAGGVTTVTNSTFSGNKAHSAATASVIVHCSLSEIPSSRTPLQEGTASVLGPLWSTAVGTSTPTALVLEQYLLIRFSGPCKITAAQRQPWPFRWPAQPSVVPTRPIVL